ncbi:MAG: type IV pilus assembly protein PilM [Planctomycetota bacterium]
MIGLDIGSHSIKAIEVTSRAGALVVTGYGEARIAAPEERANALRQLAQQRHFSGLVASSVSGRSVINRYLTLEDMPDHELANRIRFEADKYIPFEADKVVLDYQLVQRLPESKEMKVILVAVKRSEIDEHVALITSAGLTPAIIDVDIFAIGNAFELNKLMGPGALPPDKVHALVDIGANKTSINIMRGNVSQFAREIYIAGNEFLEAVGKGMNLSDAEVDALFENPGDKVDEVIELIATALDDLGNEVRLSFDYYESQFDRPVDEAYVSGGGCQLPGLERFLERIFDVKTQRWDPTERLQFSLEHVNVDEVKKNCSRLAVAVGLAARAGMG